MMALFTVLAAGCGGSSSNNSSGSGGQGGSTSSASGGSRGSVFRIGVIPYESPQQEQEEYTPFAEFVGKKMNGKPAVVTVATDYTGVIVALEANQIDAAYLNPLGYVLAADRAQKAGHPLIPVGMPLVIAKGTTKGSLTYRGIIFVRADSGINSLKDLRGKSFAFNEQTSTSGYLYPVDMLMKAGINPKEQPQGDLKGMVFAGAQGVVPAVFHKQEDAGAIFEEGIRLSYPKPEDQAQLKILARTDPIPNGMMVARGDLDPGVIKKFKQALLVGLPSEPEGKAALAKLRVEKWVPPDDSLFDPVRRAARVLGLGLSTAGQAKKS